MPRNATIENIRDLGYKDAGICFNRREISREIIEQMGIIIVALCGGPLRGECSQVRKQRNKYCQEQVLIPALDHSSAHVYMGQDFRVKRIMPGKPEELAIFGSVAE